MWWVVIWTFFTLNLFFKRFEHSTLVDSDHFSSRCCSCSVVFFRFQRTVWIPKVAFSGDSLRPCEGSCMPQETDNTTSGGPGVAQKCLDFRIPFWDFWGLQNRYVDVGMHLRNMTFQLSVEEVSIGGSRHAAGHGSLVVSSDMPTKRSGYRGFDGVLFELVVTQTPHNFWLNDLLLPSSVVATQRFLFICSPIPWGNDPTWLAYIFQLGWNSTTN